MSYDPLADLSAAVKTNTTGQSGRRARAQAEHGAGAIVQAASRDGVAGNFMVLQRLRKSMRRILTFAAGFRLLIRHLSCSELLLEAGDSDSHYSFTFRLPGQRTVRLPCGSRGADLLFVAQACCHPSACSCPLPRHRSECHLLVTSLPCATIPRCAAAPARVSCSPSRARTSTLAMTTTVITLAF